MKKESEKVNSKRRGKEYLSYEGEQDALQLTRVRSIAEAGPPKFSRVLKLLRGYLYHLSSQFPGCLHALLHLFNITFGTRISGYKVGWEHLARDHIEI